MADYLPLSFWNALIYVILMGAILLALRSLFFYVKFFWILAKGKITVGFVEKTNLRLLLTQFSIGGMGQRWATISYINDFGNKITFQQWLDNRFKSGHRVKVRYIKKGNYAQVDDYGVALIYLFYLILSIFLIFILSGEV